MYQSGQLTLVVTTNLVSLCFDKTKVYVLLMSQCHMGWAVPGSSKPCSDSGTVASSILWPR